MVQLVDQLGRRFPYLRLSVIPACNFHCTYCLPGGYHAEAGMQRALSLAEIGRLLRGFAMLGMNKLRLTGGEPSLRRDLLKVIEVAAAIPGLSKIAMTTNGCLLKRRLSDWCAAGLTALNVSVDTLDSAHFAAITGHDRLPDILEGVEMALASRLSSVKLNVVLMRGVNDQELPAWLDYLRARQITVRFIELMQTGENLAFFQRHQVRAESMEGELRAQGWHLLERADAAAGPAREYAHPDYRGHIGIIAPYSKDFCSGCNRLRVTSVGDLRLCLFGELGIPLRHWLQDDAQQPELIAAMLGQINLKHASHALHQGQTGILPNLAATGG